MTESTLGIDPQRSALLVMDYQLQMLGRIPDADRPLGKTREALECARRAQMLVAYVRIAFTDADYAAVPETNRVHPLVAAKPMTDGEPHMAIHPGVAPKADDIVVRKTRVGAFSTTDLDQQLRERGVDTLVLAGIATSGVVLSTVCDAGDRDYRLYVLEDACADRDPEVHDVLMRKVLTRQADIITVQDLVGALCL